MTAESPALGLCKMLNTLEFVGPAIYQRMDIDLHLIPRGWVYPCLNRP